MDKELLDLLNNARTSGANESQMQGIVDAYNQKKKNLATGGGNQTEVLEEPLSNTSVGADGQLQQSVPIISPSPKNTKLPSSFDLSITKEVPTVTTIDGFKFPVTELVSFVETENTPQTIQALQQRISSKTVTPQDVEVIAKSSGKSIDAVNAYIKGGQLVGGSVENVENITKTKAKLETYIKDFNTVYGTEYNPNDILSSSQKTSDFLEAAKSQKAVPSTQPDINRPISESTRMASQQNAIPALLPLDISNEMITQVVSKTIEEDNVAGVPKDETIVKIAKRLNPKEFSRIEKAKVSATDLGELFRNNTEQDELLNYQKGASEVAYNQSLKQNSINKISQGVLNNDANMIAEGQHDLSQVDEESIYKYPSLIKQQIAQAVNNEIAKDSGVVEGYDTQEGSRVTRAFGSSTAKRLEVMKTLGYLDDPRTKDIAESMAGNSTYFANNSIVGSAVQSFLQPLSDLGMSAADIIGIRTRKDIMADKIKDELFQQDFSQNAPDELQLKTDVRVARTVVNTTANLAGMLAISTATEGIAGTLGASASLGQKLGAYTSFGLPSFDASLKDSKNFIEDEPTQYLYATINSIANAEGGRLLDLGKVTRIPGVSEDFAKLAKGLSDNTITKKAARELLDGAKDKYVDFAVKYGKNVTKGAAIMAYFTTSNNIIKLGFGDPNTEATDILPQAGHAFLDGVLGMSIMGGFGAVADMRKEKNTTYKGTIYNIALNHDAAKDVFDIGLKNGEYDKAEYDNKIAILNTAVAAKNALDAAQVEAGADLTQDQKAVYVANKTAENVLRDKAKNTTLPDLKAKYESQAEKLAEQSTQTLDGLKFTTTLEPLYDLYNAEKEYNAALEKFNPTDKESSDALEVAKKNYDVLYSDYLKNNSQPSTQLSEPIKGLDEQGVPIEKAVTEKGITVEPPRTFPKPITIGGEQTTTEPIVTPEVKTEPLPSTEKIRVGLRQSGDEFSIGTFTQGEKNDFNQKVDLTKEERKELTEIEADEQLDGKSGETVKRRQDLANKIIERNGLSDKVTAGGETTQPPTVVKSKEGVSSKIEGSGVGGDVDTAIENAKKEQTYDSINDIPENSGEAIKKKRDFIKSLLDEKHDAYDSWQGKVTKQFVIQDTPRTKLQEIYDRLEQSLPTQEVKDNKSKPQPPTVESEEVDNYGLTKVETDKAVMNGWVDDKVLVNDENVSLPEKGFLISDVNLKEGEKKGIGSGQELYKKALDEHGVLYSAFPISEDAIRAQNKLVEKGVAKIETVTLSDGTELRKITPTKSENKPTQNEQDKATETTNVVLKPTDIHELAKEKGIDFESKDFMDKSEELTGERHLDKMNGEQLQKVKDYVSSQPKSEKSISLPPVGKETETVIEPGDEVVGITHAEISKTRNELGLPEYGGKAIETHEQLLETAQELIKGGYNLNKIFDKVKNSEPTSNVENAIMAEYKAALDVEMAKNPTKETLKKLTEFATISDEAGTFLGKGLESRKILKKLSEADTLANFLVIRQNDKGHPLSDAQIKEQTAKFNELTKAKDALAAALKIEQEKNVALIAEQGLKKAQQTRKRDAKKTHEEYKAERDELAKSIKEKWKNAGKDILSSDIPYRKQIAAIAPDVKRYVETLLSEGIDKLDNIVNTIHTDLKDALEGISKKDIMDIIGGVHDVKKPTANEKNAELRLLKREAELLNTLQRERLGEEKAKNESQKAEKSRRIQELENKIKEVRQQKKERVIENEPVRENTATGEENKAEQKRLTKRIEKLQEDLKNKNYAPEVKKEKTLALTRKTQLLQDKVIELENKIQQERYKDERSKMSKWEKAWDAFQNVAGIRRVVQTALDASIWFRQLGSLALNPRRWDIAKKFIVAGSRSVFSQTNYDRYMNAIHKAEDFKESLKDGIRYNELNTADPKSQNEFFPRSFIYKIPIVRELITASQRVADSSLNVARYELYNKYKERLLKQGITRESDPEMYKAMAKVVMNSTGSGNLLSALENHKAEKVMGALFYGARLMASNFNVLNPLYYAKLPKPVRAEAMKDLASYTTTILATGLGLAAAGGKISLDPDESGFLQIRFGKKIYDITGGKAAYIRTFLRLVEAGYSRATKTKYEAGKATEFGGESVLRFFRNKLSPNTSYAVNAFTGKNTIGEDFDPAEVLKIYPMYADDAYKAAKEDGYVSLLTVVMPNILGVGYGNYYSEPAMKPIEETLQRNMRSDEINKESIKNYNNDGSQITDKEFQIYIEKRDAAIEKGIRDLYEGTAPENMVLDENNEVVTKKYNKLSKEQIIAATSSIKRRATNEVKEELFGKKEDTKDDKKAKKELSEARKENNEEQ